MLVLWSRTFTELCSVLTLEVAGLAGLLKCMMCICDGKRSEKLSWIDKLRGKSRYLPKINQAF